MKAIMYHYVRPFDPAYPFFKGLNVDDFKQQLDYFEAEYGFVGKADFLEALRTGKPAKGVVLTFDDGLSCHFDFVYSELKRRNLWGVFYVPTQPLVEQKMLGVHRTHVLLGRVPAEEVYHYLKEITDEGQIDQAKYADFNELTYARQQNSNFTLLVKRTLNYFLAYEHCESVLDAMMQRFVPAEDDVLSTYYCSPDQLREMHEGGMVIGSHTVSHPVMSRLSVEDQREEIEASFGYLGGLLGTFDQKTFCYPYGGFHSFTGETESLLNDNDCLYSFNVEQRDIVTADLRDRPQALPRYDCNQFKHGQVRTH
jgi:peptidoglycan/xylan/chitin deacetylase (PgdA/CDA1 family)